MLQELVLGKLFVNSDVEMFRRSFRISIAIGAIAAFVILFTGHWQAQYFIQSQPMKMAAAEALWEKSGDPAPFTVIADIDTEKKENNLEIQIPYM